MFRMSRLWSSCMNKVIAFVCACVLGACCAEAQATGVTTSLVAGGGSDASGNYSGLATGAKLAAPTQVVLDDRENLYILDKSSRSVRVVASGRGAIPSIPSVPQPIAGNIYTVISSGLTAPESLTVDHYGNVYVADRGDNTIKVLFVTGRLPNLPSNSIVGKLYTIAGVSGGSGTGAEGVPATSSELNAPMGVGVDPNGNIYIADTANHRVRVVYHSGTVPSIPSNAVPGNIYTFAGSTQSPCTAQLSAASACGDGNSASSARLNLPVSLVSDQNGNIYVSDDGDARVRVIASGSPIPGLQQPVAGNIYTVAGTGVPGAGANSILATRSAISSQIGQLSLDPLGQLYISDLGNNAIRKVDLTGTVSTVDGLAAPGKTSVLSGVAAMSMNTFYLSDVANGTVQSISTVQDENISSVRRPVQAASKIVTHADDSSSSSVPMIPGVPATQGYINTVAGYNALVGPGSTPATQALISSSGLAFDASGNLYISTGGQPSNSAEVLMLDAATDAVSVIAGGTYNNSPPDGSASINSWLSGASALAFDSKGDLFIASATDDVIDEIPAGSTNLLIYAGQFQNSGKSADGGTAANAKFNDPIGIALDASDNMYVVDQSNRIIRKITSDGSKVTTVAGTGDNCPTESACGDGGPATSAQMNTPTGVAVDTNGNIFIVDDDYGFGVRVVYNGGAAMACLLALENPSQFTLAGNATSCAGATPPVPTPMPIVGHIYLIAGAGGSDGSCYDSPPPCGDGGLATQAEFDAPPGGIAVDGAGNIFISDSNDIVVQRVDVQTGIITSVIGNQTTNSSYASGYYGDEGPATSALIASSESSYNINGLAIDTFGNLFYADAGNSAIRAVAEIAAPPLTPQTITFTLPSGTYTYGAQAITLGATSNSSAEPITYTLSGCTTCASLSGTSPNVTLTITGATPSGQEVTVTANQTGDTTHLAATPVSQSFTVSPATLSVAPKNVSVPFGTTATQALALLTYTPTGLVGSDTLTGTPAYTITDCSDNNPYSATTAVGTTCTITITGSGSLTASPSSDYTIQAGGTAMLTVTGGGSNTITFSTLTGPFTYGQAPIALSATATSGLPITYTSSNNSVAVVTGSSSLTFTGAGTVTITASQGATVNTARQRRSAKSSRWAAQP